MASFTIEKVARRAAASRMTIYKWWPSRGALALDGYFTLTQHELAIPDTGDIYADLLTQIRVFAHQLRDTSAGRVLAEIIGAAQTDPDLAAAFTRHYAGPRRDIAKQAIRRGIDRGQIRPGTDPAVVVDQLWGACWHRLLLFREPVTDQFAETIVHNIMTGLRP